jgi:hypothetical protein
MKKHFKAKFKREFLECLIGLIKKLAELPVEDDEDKLLISVLVELLQKLQLKELQYKQQYSIPIKPAEAFALRIVFADYGIDVKTYLGIHLLKLSNTAHKYYNN